MRRNARTDDNHAQIVRALTDCGCTVQSLAPVGDGCPDILVGLRGVTYLMEIKNGAMVASGRKLKPAQVKWHAWWRGHVVVVKSVADALTAVGLRHG